MYELFLFYFILQKKKKEEEKKKKEMLTYEVQIYYRKGLKQQRT